MYMDRLPKHKPKGANNKVFCPEYHTHKCRVPLKNGQIFSGAGPGVPGGFLKGGGGAN